MRLALATVLFSLAAAAPAAADPSFEPPPGTVLRPVLTLAPASEPGQRMIVTGRLFRKDGKTPRPGVVIGAYQTDAKGDYGRDAEVPEWARLHGWLRTDSLGRYEIRTIRPGAYPQQNFAQHIHFVIQSGDDWDGSNELQFEDDRLVSSAARERSRREGRFGQVRPVKKSPDGVQRVERDFRLD